MGLFDLVANTVEGVAEVAVNVVKAPIGVATMTFDEGETLDEAGDGITKGLSKIGKSSPRGKK